MLRELVTRPISIVGSLLELPRSMQRNVREANELMNVSRDQLETIRRQADAALEQAERMNDLLARLVKLTEPLERAQRGGEYVSERLKRALLGEEDAERAIEEVEVVAELVEEAADDAEAAAEESEPER